MRSYVMLCSKGKNTQIHTIVSNTDNMYPVNTIRNMLSLDRDGSLGNTEGGGGRVYY